MNYIVFEHQGFLYYCTRLERVCFVDANIKHGIKDFGIVIKTFEKKEDAIIYCEKINFVNDLIKNI